MIGMTDRNQNPRRIPESWRRWRATRAAGHDRMTDAELAPIIKEMPQGMTFDQKLAYMQRYEAFAAGYRAGEAEGRKTGRREGMDATAAFNSFWGLSPKG